MRPILIWFVAVFTASVLSSVVAVGGWALNYSLLPPMGGGTFKLIILPVGVV